MAELETLYVRIETDLTAFNRGMAEARTVTQEFATDARDTFSGVATALDLSGFRRQLTTSERAAKESAARMKKAFAEVGIAQEKAARRCLEKFALYPVVPTSGASGSGRSNAERPFGFTKEQEETSTRFGLGLGGAGVAAGAAPWLAAALGISTGGLALIIVAAGALAAYSPEIIKGLSGGDSDEALTLGEKIEVLNNTIQGLLDQKGPQQARPGMGVSRDERLETARKQLAGLEAMRDAIQEQQRQAGETATQFQDFLGAFTELSTCLRELCARLDSLAPLPPGGADAPGAQQMRFDGAAGGAGGGIIPASFSGASSFGGNGLDLFNEQLQATGWRAGDAAAQIADLTERAGGYRAEAGALSRVLRENNVVFDDQIGVVRLLDALLPELGAGLTGVFTEAGVAGRDFDDVAAALGDTLTEAFKGAAFEGKSLRDVLRGVLDDILNLAQSSIGGGGGGSSFLGTLLNSAVGALFGTATPSGPGPGAGPPMRGALPAPFVPPPPFGIDIRAAAKGAAFLRGATLPEAMAKGGVLHNSVVSRPTLFAMAKGYGLMGEAGPEAVMPLTRLPNGELGVRGMAGGGGAAAPGPVNGIFTEAGVAGAKFDNIAKAPRGTLIAT